MWVELAGSVIPPNGVLGELSPTSSDTAILGHDFEDFQNLEPEAPWGPVHQGVQDIMADALVGVLDQVKEPVPDLGYVALDMAWAQIADCHLPHPRVVVVGQVQQPVDLVTSSPLAGHGQTDADSLPDHCYRMVELSHMAKFSPRRRRGQAGLGQIVLSPNPTVWCLAPLPPFPG